MARSTKKTKLVEDRIIAFLAKQPDRKFKSKAIARSLNIPGKDYVDFRNLLRDLSRQGVVAKAGPNAYQLKTKPQLAIGRLKVKSQGYGFVETEEGGGEVFVSQRNMSTAIDGDLVAMQLYAKPKDGLLPEGKIDHVIERKRKHIVGTFKHGKYSDYVVPDDKKIPWDIIIHEGFSKNAEPGQKVAVRLDHWEDSGLNPSGRVIKVLGHPGEPGVDSSAIEFKFNLQTRFPKQVGAECRAISTEISESDIQGRLDLRDRVCFTIDPDEAKDFDDAVSLEILDNGNSLLGVHIADVSHYVPEGGAIDGEALERGTSVYLVERVIPMLPEKLSNQICSLKPNEDRLTFSIMMELTPGGHPLNYEIRPSILHSKNRFTYEEVQEILDSGRGDRHEILAAMRDLSQTLYRKRLKAGSLDFEMAEAKIHLDDLGNPVAISRRERLQSHQLIEEFMLLANRMVCEYVAVKIPQDRQLSKRWPFVYRVHERPDAKKIAEFANLVRSLGFGFNEKKRISPKQLQEVIKAVRGLPEEDIINYVMLRSLMKAKYDTKNAGHFGLAFHHYTHFTSPIRRYPDLIVHRLLKEYAEKPSDQRISDLREGLPRICEISSDQEINAMQAERESVKMMQTKFMVDKLGEEYDGVISGIVPFGIFVEIVDFMVEGLVHVKDLAGDYYIHDEANYRLVGQTTGKTYRLGDRVKIQVIRVVPEERLIDFRLIEEEEVSSKPSGPIRRKKPRPFKKRGSRKGK
jgi:ribonuclease R